MRLPNLNNYSIRTLTKSIIGLMIIATLFFGVVGATAIRFIGETEDAWMEYKHSNAPRATALASVVGSLGYGGMIHQFKNAVIRTDPARADKVFYHASIALNGLERIELLDQTDQTLAATQQIRSVINAYVENTKTLISMVNDGRSAAEIDTALKIDDTPAIAGLEVLFTQLRTLENDRPLSKSFYLGELRRALGYNGMIHHYKNYVLRHDAPRIDKINGAMVAVQDAIEAYKALGVTAAEQSALADIEFVLSKYSRGLDAAQELIGNGAGIAELDSRIKVNDAPALAGFDVLVQAIAQETGRASAIVSEDLTLVKSVNMIVSIMIAVVAVLISVSMYLALNRGIVRPAETISDALEQLSNGNTDVNFDALSSDTEIGKIARVSNVFRDSLIHNQLMAKEQEKTLAEQKEMATKQSHLLEEQKRMSEKQQLAAEEAGKKREQTDDFQRKMHSVVDAAAQGDFTKRITISFSNSDLIDIANSFNSLMNTVDTGIAEANRVIACLAESDLNERMSGDFSGTFEFLQTSMNDALATLSGAIENVSDSAGRITTDTSQITQASQQLANRTETQAITLGQASTSLNQLTASVQSVAEGAQHANEVVSNAKQQADESGGVVTEAINAMGAIEESSAKISKIISVIDDIAFQTNLLALNAGVEAARAGEAGRGFAVVASEVRGLAQRSSEAAREIGDLISNSESEVKRGVALVDRAGDSLKNIAESVASISSHVKTVAVSAKEQAVELSGVNTAIIQLDEVTQQNVAMFEETTASTQNLSQEADTLFNTVSQFRIGGRGQTTSEPAAGDVEGLSNGVSIAS